MIFDTDVLISAEKGDPRAIVLLGDADEKAISIVTYMELLHGLSSKAQIQTVKNFISEGVFEILPLTENIGHRALVYVEQYAASSGLRAMDALIAATAVENNRLLVSGNRKHFKFIEELKFKPFKVV